MIYIDKGNVVVKSWCNSLEESTVGQVVNVANHPEIFHHVVLCPDAHMGMGMPIGCVAALNHAVSPNMVGSDIACGMLAWKTVFKKTDLDRNALMLLLTIIKSRVPMGSIEEKDGVWSAAKGHQHDDRWMKEATRLFNDYVIDCEKNSLAIHDRVTIKEIASNLGTLGAGNHYIEIQHDEEDCVWVMIHSGSRFLGGTIGGTAHETALALNEKWHSQISHRDLAFLPIDSEEGQTYLNDVKFCVEFSFQNRLCMMSDIKDAFDEVSGKKTEEVEMHNIHHNFVAIEHHFGKNVWVHRKGATRVREGEVGIIPGSMGSASHIVCGKGNPESFCSCSHGAGRAMSRNAANRRFSLEEFREKMRDVVSLDVDDKHIDESPMAYKSIETVMSEQKDLVDVVHTLRPLANCKG